MQGTFSYTPLDIRRLEEKFKGKITKRNDFDNTFNTILLVLATVSVMVLSIVLFILIKKQI